MTIKYILKKTASDVFPAVNCRLFGVYVTQKKNTFYIDHSIINDCGDRRKIKRTQT